MRGLFHEFTLFVMIMIFMWIGVCYVTLNIQYTRAKQMHDEITVRLENHGLDQKTILECKTMAKEAGYELTIDTIRELQQNYAKVVLDMRYQFPILQDTKHYSISGYVW